MAASSAKEKRVFAETLKSARLGLADAQYELGLMYANGIGVAQNIEQAVHWVAQAAQRGLVSAQYLLGTRYASGIGVAQSEHLAVLWLGKAAEQGHSKARLRLGNIYAMPHPAQAADFYREAAQAGLAAAQFALSQAYASGAGVPQDDEWALHWCQQAADQGWALAQHALAERYLQGHGLAPDPEQALRLFRQAAAQNHVAAQVAIERMGGERGKGERAGNRRRPGGAERRQDEARWVSAAENGNAYAKYHLGLMYSQGLGLAQDPQQAARWFLDAAMQNHVPAQLALAQLQEAAQLAEAVQWYQKAAEAGNTEAQCALGRLYSAGELVAPNPLQSMAWYLRAGLDGEALAMRNLGTLLQADLHAAAVTCFTEAARKGDVQAQFLLGQHLERGQGVSKNLAQAFYWFEKAALQSWPQAMGAVGVAYLRGLGVAKDAKRALAWLQKGADLGDARAQWNLSAMYASGSGGLARDLKLAFVWCQRAAEQGFVAAQSNLGALYALADNPAQAAACWQKAATQGDAEATYNLALAYAKGAGVQQDADRAFALLHDAARQGLAPAQARLGLMYATGDSVVQDPIEAHKWFAIAADHGDASAKANLARSEGLNSVAAVAEGRRRASEWKYSRLS